MIAKLLLLLLVSLSLAAQDVRHVDVRDGTTLPSTCSVGRFFFFDTDDGTVWFCSATDTWTQLSAGGAGSPVDIDVNAQTGTTYTVQASDKGKNVTHSNAAATAVTLPQATGSFADGWWYYTKNLGAGLVTITPTTSTINGASKLTLHRGRSGLITSDGTNYHFYGQQETFYNVKSDCGVLGDVTTDDTTVVQACADTAFAASGTLFFPEGDYLIDQLKVNNRSNVTILCHRARLIRRETSSTAGEVGLITVYGTSSHVDIVGCELDGNYASVTIGGVTENNHGIYLLNATDVRIRDCYIHSTGNRTATGNDFFGDNIRVRIAERVLISNNISEDAGRWHVAVAEAKDVQITGNHFEELDNTTANNLGLIDLEAEHSDDIESVVLANNTSRGVLALPSSSSSYTVTDVTISNNVLVAADVNDALPQGTAYQYGIYIGDNVSNFNLLGNLLIWPSTTAGLLIDDTTSNITALGNTFDGQRIYVDPAATLDKFKFLGNTVVTAASRGLDFPSGATVTNFLVAANDIEATAAAAVACYFSADASLGSINGNSCRSTAGSGSGAYFMSPTTTIVGNRLVGVSESRWYAKTDSSFLNNTSDTAVRVYTSGGATGSLIGSNNAPFSVTGGAWGSQEGMTVLPGAFTPMPAVIDVASAGTVTLPFGELFHITGTTNITTLNTCDATNARRVVTLIFDGILDFSDGNNLKLSGTFTTSADDVIKLVCDGANWYQVGAESVN